MKTSLVLILTLLFACALLAQTKPLDTGKIMEYKNAFWDSIKTAADDYAEEKETKKKKFIMDFSDKSYPTNISEYTRLWHNAPVSQGRSGMCWCYATTSYFESEMKRIHDKEIKLSELHTVYYEYIEKARRFIRERGDSEFGQGSEANAVPRIWKKYGVVPAEIYTGMKKDQPFHDHDTMFEEIEAYLKYIKEKNIWNENQALENVKSILNHYIGMPPKSFKYAGKEYTPQSFLKKVVKLEMADYIDFMSLMEVPYWQKGEYKVPDNWWLNEDYYNVPLDDFMAILKKAVREGYSVGIGGDVSESGYNSHREVAVVPAYDIPSSYIDENARQFRFSNESTTDDHAIHVVGFLEKDGADWYLIKDSGSGSRNGKNKGYYFYHEDYVKLKMMNLFLHKDAVKDVLKKFK